MNSINHQNLNNLDPMGKSIINNQFQKKNINLVKIKESNNNKIFVVDWKFKFSIDAEEEELRIEDNWEEEIISDDDEDEEIEQNEISLVDFNILNTHNKNIKNTNVINININNDTDNNIYALNYFIDCSICINAFQVSEELLVINKCKHYFHSLCLAKWIINKGDNFCPLCCN